MSTDVKLRAPMHDVDIKRIREHLQRATDGMNDISAEELIYGISMALVDHQFASALDAIIESGEGTRALYTYVHAAYRDAIGKDAQTSPRTMREAVRRMQAVALGAVQKFIRVDNIERRVESWLDNMMRKYVTAIIGLRDDGFGRIELAASSEKTVVGKTIEERCKAAVDAALPKIIDKALAELDGEWEKVLADAIKNIKRNFNHKLTREMERRISVEADNRMTELLTRALMDNGDEPQGL